MHHDRLAQYDAFTQEYLGLFHAHTASRRPSRARAPWQSIVDLGLYQLSDIPTDVISHRSTSLFKQYPELVDRLWEVTSWLPSEAGLTERLYCVYHRLTQRPTCLHCGTELTPSASGIFRFIGNPKYGTKTGYGKYCSNACAVAHMPVRSEQVAADILAQASCVEPLDVPTDPSEAREMLFQFASEACPSATVMRDVTTLIDGEPLDVVVPSRRLAIQYNVLRQQSEAAGGTHYGYQQERLNQLKALGYRLLIVWEDDWREHPATIRHMVTDACAGGTFINAKQCRIEHGVGLSAAMDALHPKGALGGTGTTYALVDEKGRGVAALQVAHRGKDTKGMGATAVRYATMCGYYVPNGLERLMQAVTARTLGPKVFRVELDPAFDDVQPYHLSGFKLEGERSEQVWYTLPPDLYQTRRPRKDFRAFDKEAAQQPKPFSVYSARWVQRAGCDRIWGTRRQQWTYYHTPE